MNSALGTVDGRRILMRLAGAFAGHQRSLLV
jgi:hypothetical protein